MRRFVLLYFCLLLTACSQQDVLIKNHSLLGQKIQAPDYVLAVVNLPLGYSGSQKLHQVNAHLFGIDEALRLGYSIENRETSVKEIFTQGETPLVVKEVYFIKPGLLASFFNSGTYFALLEDDKKNRYTVSLFRDQPMLEINQCESNRQCANRRFHLNKIFKDLEKDKQKKHALFIDYLPISNATPKANSKENQTIEESNKEFADFLKSKNITVTEDLKYRPSLVVEVDYLQYGDLILYSSLFNIQNVSSYEKIN